MRQKKLLILVTLIPFVLAAGVLSVWYLNVNRAASFTPIDFLWDIHAIALNPQDESMLYVATHLGLIRGIKDTNWELIGNDQSDFMGFSIDPNQPTVMYSSGHPQVSKPPRAGQLGFRRSEDAGQNWEPVQFYGQKDLHSISVSPVQPRRIYAWDGQALLRTDDGGQYWTMPEANGLDYNPVQFENGINALVTDPKDVNKIWAATNNGVYWSNDAGDTWKPMLAFYEKDITALELQVDLTLLYSADNTLWMSRGESWTPIEHNLLDRIIDFSISKDLSVWYAASNKAIYKSTDQGETWALVRDIGRPQ